MPERDYFGTPYEAFETFFAAIFIGAAEDGGPPKYMAGAHSSGEIRIYQTDALIFSSKRGSSMVQPILRISAHTGPVYALQKIETGSDTLLFSGGDDGRLCAWSWKDLEARLPCLHLPSSSNNNEFLLGSNFWSQGRPQVQNVKPLLDTALAPGGSEQSTHGTPEVNCISIADSNFHTIYAGTGDGQWHMLDTANLKPKRSQTPSACHSLGVLSIDSSLVHSSVSTGSEDGTVRIWDYRNLKCTAAFDPVSELRVPATTTLSMDCENPRFVPCVHFDPQGNWLLCGSSSPSLSFWSLGLGALVHQVSLNATPQALVTHEDEIIVVGAEPLASRFNFRGVPTQEVPLTVSSAYSICIDETSHGMLVSGSGSAMQVLSQSGQPLGSLSATRLEDYCNMMDWVEIEGDVELGEWHF